MEILIGEPITFRHLNEALFCQVAWQGYRDAHFKQYGEFLADVRENRRRFLLTMHLTLDRALMAQRN